MGSYSPQGCVEDEHILLLPASAWEAIGESSPILYVLPGSRYVLSGSRSVLRLLLQAPFHWLILGDPWRQRCPFSVATPFRRPRVELIEMAAWSIWPRGGRGGAKRPKNKKTRIFPTKGGEKRLKASQRGVFHPSRPPLAGTPRGITPPTQRDCYHVSIIHKVRRGKDGC